MDEKAFWNKRFLECGHTGWCDDVLYEYDQALRLSALRRVVLQRQGSLQGKNALDIGCGVGDFSMMLAELGAKVTGIDICENAVNIASKRCFERKIPCNFYTLSVTDVDTLNDTFDVAISITVLQHISDEDILAAANKIISLLKPGGYVYILEAAPLSLCDGREIDYVHIRNRACWINLFRESGATFIYDMMYPSFGIFLLRNRYIKRLYRTLKPCVKRTSRTGGHFGGPTGVGGHSLISLFERIMLWIARPVDHLCLYTPQISIFGSMRLMVFQKKCS